MRYVRVSLPRQGPERYQRVYTTDMGDLKPERKGVALNLEKWNQLKKIIRDIDTVIPKI